MPTVPQDLTSDAELIRDMWDDESIDFIEEEDPFSETLEEAKFFERQGTEVYFTGRNPLAPVDAALTTSVEQTDPTVVAITGRKIKANLYRIHSTIGFTALAEQVSFDQIVDMLDIVRDNIRTSEQLHNVKTVAPQLLHFRADWDTASPYQTQFTADGTGSTTTVTSAELDQADDYWGGSAGSIGYLSNISKTSRGYAQGRLSTDFANSGDLVTFGAAGGSLAALNRATVSGERFHICIGTGLTTNDVLTMRVFSRINGFLGGGSLNIPNKFKFRTKGGFGFKVFMSSFDREDLINDSAYQTYLQNNGGAPGFDKWAFGNLYNNDLFEYSQIYRESAAGAYSATGAVFNVLGMGKGIARRKVLNKAKIIPIMKPDSNNPAGYRRYITYTEDYAVGIVLTTGGFNIMTVPSAA